MMFARSIFSAAFGLVFLGAAATSSQAAVLANYNFDSGVPSADTDAGSTAGNFSTTYPSANSGYSSASNNYFVRVQVTPLALDPARYFAFSVSAVAGNVLNLSSLSLRSSLSDNNSPDFDGTIVIRSSVDNYAADIGTITQASTDGAVFTARGPFDLSGSQYQNLSSVTFRFYLFDSSDSSATTSIVHRVDDVVLNGEAIPEVSTLGLAALAGASLLGRRKR